MPDVMSEATIKNYGCVNSISFCGSSIDGER